MLITNFAEFETALSQGPFTFPGCYPVYFVTRDGGTISYDAAVENKTLISNAIENPGTDDQWEIVGADVNLEDPALYCDHSNTRIQSAYAEE